MKAIRPLLLLASLALAPFAVLCAKPEAGPKGGRLLDIPPLKAEFFVTPERKVEITYYDAALRPAAPGERAASVIAEPASGRVTVSLAKTATGFISTSALPAGDPYRVVLQLRETPGARPTNFRLDLNLELCAECQRKEYACTCEGH